MSTVEMPYMHEEPLYRVIWEQINAGEVVPFLGSGASLVDRPIDEHGQPLPWTGSHAAFLPTVPELGRWLAVRCGFPDPAESADLAKIASYHEIQTRRSILVRSLRDVFSKEYAFGPIHAFLAECPRPLLIVTTNYDNLIEKAFQAKGRPYHLVTHPEREEYAASVLWWKPGAGAPEMFKPSVLPLSLTDTSIIYKMHGTASVDSVNSFVITEEDYVRVLARMSDKLAIPARFMMHFMKSSFLFLGYGLRDWNVRVMLETLHSTVRYDRSNKQASSEFIEPDTIERLLSSFGSDEPDLPSWAIQHHPSRVERRLWEHRHVNIFDLSLDDFVAQMRRERSREADQ
jgi:hypothetical protein